LDSQLFLSVVGIQEGNFTLLASSWRMGSFWEAFGVTPQIFFIVWMMCWIGQLPGIQAKHILWALCFMKVYATQNVLKSMVGNP
jgi:hypothetical protein